MSRTSIITLLKADHREVTHLFEQLAAVNSPTKRRTLFAAIDQALSLHADFEEANVYPLLKQRKDTRDAALEAVEEHGQIKRLLADLRTLEADDVRWKAKLTVLSEDVRHHVKEEEGTVFPELSEAAAEVDLVALGAQYQEAKSGVAAEH